MNPFNTIFSFEGRLKIRFAAPLIASILLILNSCDPMEIEFNAEQRQAKIVLNAVVQVDSVISCYVHRTVFSLEPNRAIRPLTNATVVLQVEGRTIDTLRHVSNGFYTGNVIARADKVYRFVVSVNGYPTAKAQSQVIVPTQIIALEKVGTQTSPSGGRILTFFRLKFEKDPLNQGFYSFSPYREISVDVYDSDGNIIDTIFSRESLYVDIEYSKGIEFYRQIFLSSFQGYINCYIAKYYFTDKLVTSNNTAIVEFALEGYSSVDNFYVAVEKISPDMFYYHQSLGALQNNSDFLLFTQPVQVFSNIDDGLGIVGTVLNYEPLEYRQSGQP